MNKDEILRILRETSEELEQIADSTARPPAADGERLFLKFIKGRPTYYCRGKDGRLVYVRTSDRKRIERLSTEYYERKLRAAAVKEKKQIDRCLELLGKNPEASDVDKVAGKIPQAIRNNARLSELTGEGYARKWQDCNVVVKKYNIRKEDDYHKHKTLRGDYVGSKSELIIADRLYVRGIPYHYEVALPPDAALERARPVFNEFGMVEGYEVTGFSPFDSDTLHPDFYVLNKRTRKAYFWEHLGRMDDPEYCMKNLNRFMRILDSGYIIGQDLIVTHEDSQNPLRTESIDAIIERYLT